MEGLLSTGPTPSSFKALTDEESRITGLQVRQVMYLEGAPRTSSPRVCVSKYNATKHFFFYPSSVINTLIEYHRCPPMLL